MKERNGWLQGPSFFSLPFSVFYGDKPKIYSSRELHRLTTKNEEEAKSEGPWRRTSCQLQTAVRTCKAKTNSFYMASPSTTVSSSSPETMTKGIKIDGRFYYHVNMPPPLDISPDKLPQPPPSTPPLPRYHQQWEQTVTEDSQWTTIKTPR